MTEQESVRQSVQQQQSYHQQVAPSIVSWPPSGSVSLTMRDTYYGDTIGNYLEQVMMWYIFKTLLLRYFALITNISWRALQVGHIYIPQMLSCLLNSFEEHFPTMSSTMLLYGEMS